MTTVRRTHHGWAVDADEIEERLRTAGNTVGRTRSSIIAGVRAQPVAFTAEQLADTLPNVHLATVYRTLNLLEEIGAVRHVHLSHGPALYERADADAVRHLVCEVCERHVTVPVELFESVGERLTADYGFTLDGSHFAVVGRCVECAARTDGASDTRDAPP